MSAKLLIAYAHMRTASPSLRSSPRQAVVRASFWLATQITNRSFDLPVSETLDASDRLLPPNRTACTRTSCVPDPLSRLSPRGHPTESLAPCGIAGERGVSRLPHPLRWIVPRHNRLPRGLLGSASLVRSPRDDRLQRTWALSSHRARNSIEPLTSLSPLPLPVRLNHLRDSSLGRFRVIASEP